MIEMRVNDKRTVYKIKIYTYNNVPHRFFNPLIYIKVINN